MGALGATMTQQDDATSQQDAAPLHPREDQTPNRSLLNDTGISALITIGIMTFVWCALASLNNPVGQFFLVLLFPIALFVIFIGPAAVAIYGMVKRRPGFIAGPFVVVSLSVFWADMYVRYTAAAARSAATTDLAKPNRDHTVLAVDTNSSICADECIRVLATSAHTVAYKDRDAWVLYRRGEGPICHTEETLQSALAFLKVGFPGFCALQTRTRDLPDALMVRSRFVSETGSVAIGLPHSFSGTVIELLEQADGQQRLLGRQVSGSTRVPVPGTIRFFALFGAGSRSIQAGPDIDPKGFLLSASGVPAGNQAGDSIPRDQLLDDIETFVDHPKTSGQAVSAWLEVARAGRFAIGNAFDPRITRLLNSADPRRIELGLIAVNGRGTRDHDFALDRIVALAFDPMMDLKEAPILPRLRTNLDKSDPLPPAVRERAKQAFLTDDSLGQGRFQTLFQIMVRGGPDNRREAVDALFSLQGQRFEQAVEAIGRNGTAVWARSNPNRWSEQDIDRLIERLPGIPAERLEPYLNAFRFTGSMTSQHKDRLVSNIRGRLDTATNAPQPNDTEIKHLKRFIEIIPKNL